MSTTIDERVVEMRFDNKQFESNVSQSMKTVESLKNSLDLSKSLNSFNMLDKVGSNFNLDGAINGVEDLKGRFSALEIIGFTALQNITNKAIDAGLNIARSLSLDQITSGFSEYELKMGSVQTIMASTGASLDEVMGYLGELNTYADKTIYSFSDMTSSIGKFTNAGVDLKTAVAAIQGVSNEAAVSGANAQEASRAMYNFAQALSAGYVKLIDWKSIENANMATVEFKNQLLETAVACGTVKKNSDGLYTVMTKNAQGSVMKEAIDATHSFNDSLAFQWMTTDVLTKTLAKYADANTDIGKKAFAAAQDVKTFSQLMDTLKEAVGSGWAETFEILIGNFDEAKALFTGISNTLGDFIGTVANTRNGVLQYWKSFGGREKVIQALTAAFKAFTSIVKVAKEAFETIIPLGTLAEQGMALDNITSKFLEFTKKLQLSDKALGGLKVIFEGLFSVVKIGMGVVSSAASLFGKIAGAAASAAVSVLEFIGSIAKHDVGDGKFLYELSRGFRQLAYVIGEVSQKVKDFFANLSSSAKTFESSVSNLPGVQRLVANLKLLGQDIQNGIVKGLKTVIKWLEDLSGTDVEMPSFDGVLGIIDKVANALAYLIESFREGRDIAAEFLQVFTSKASGIIGIVTGKLQGFFSVFTADKETRAKKISSLFEKFNSVLKVLGSIAARVGSEIEKIAVMIGENLQKAISGVSIEQASKNFLSILSGGLFASILLKVRNFVKGIFGETDGAKEKVSILERVFGETFTNIIDGITDSLEAMQSKLKSDILINIAKSVAILAASLFAVSLIEPERLSSSIKAITVMFLELYEVMKAFIKIAGDANAKNITAISGSLIAISVAMLILSAAMKNVANLSWEEITRGMGGITVMAAVLIGAATGLQKADKDIRKAASGLVVFAVAMRLLVSSVKALGAIDTDTLSQGLLAVGALLAEISAFLSFTKFSGMSVSVGAGLLIMSAAILVLCQAVKKFSAMDQNGMIQGLAGLATVMAVFAGFIKVTNDSKGVVKTATGMAIMAVAMKMLVSVVKGFGKLDTEQLSKGLLSLAISLKIIEVAIKSMPKNTAAIGAGMVIMAGALLMLVASIKLLGRMELSELAIGLTGMAGALIILAGVMTLMTGTIAGSAAMLVMVGAISLLVPLLAALGAMPLAMIGKSLLVLFGALSLLGVASVALSAFGAAMLPTMAAFALFGVALTGIGIGLVTISAGITALSTGFSVSAFAIVTAIGEVLTGIIGWIPKIVLAVAGIITAVGQAIIQCAPVIMSAIATILVAVLDAIVKVIPKAVVVIAEIVVALINALAEYGPQLVDAGVNLVISFINGMADGIRNRGPQFVDAVENLLSALSDIVVMGLQALVSEIPMVGDKLAEQMEGWKSTAKDTLSPSDMEATSSKAVDGLATGISNGTDKVANAASSLGTTAFTSISTALVGVGEEGTKVSNLFGDGMLVGSDKIIDATNTIGGMPLAGFAAFTDQYSAAGLEVPTLFAGGIEDGSGDVTEAIMKMTEGVTDPLDSLSGEMSVKGTENVTSYMDAVTDKTDEVRENGSIVSETHIEGLEENSPKYADVANEDVYTFIGTIAEHNDEIKDAGIQMGNTGVEGAESTVDSFVDTGVHGGQGLIKGLLSMLGEAFKAGEALGNEASAGARSALDVNSPSRVMMAIGGYTGEGLVLGINSYANKVASASSGLGEMAVDSMTAAISRISDAVNNNIDDVITITPVLDLSNVQNGVGKLNGMLGETQYYAAAQISGSGTVQSAYDRQNEIDNKIQVALSNALSDSMNRQARLLERFDEVLPQIGNMQVVMDSGALVGSISGRMDSALGQRYRMQGRR